MKLLSRLLLLAALATSAAFAQTNFWVDSFNGTTGTGLSAHTLSTPSAPTGGTYTVQNGTGAEPQLTGSNALNPSTTAGFYQYTISATPANATYSTSYTANYGGYAAATGVFTTLRNTTSGGLSCYVFGTWSAYDGTHFIFGYITGGGGLVGKQVSTVAYPTSGSHTLVVNRTISGGNNVFNVFLDPAGANTPVFTSLTDANLDTSIGTAGLWTFPGGTNDISVSNFTAFLPNAGLMAGNITSAGLTNTTIGVYSAAASGGTGPYTFQWQNGTSSGGETASTGLGVTGTGTTTAPSAVITGLTTNSTNNYIRMKVTDSASAVAFSNELGPLTTTNNSEFAPNNAAMYYDPYVYSTTSSGIIHSATTNWGAKMEFNATFTSGTTNAITMAFDESIFGSSALYPIVRYTISSGSGTNMISGTWNVTTLGPTVFTVPIATGLSAGTYNVKLYPYWMSTNGADDVWTNTPLPGETVSLLTLALSSGGTIAAPTEPTDYMLILGDSITRGFYVNTAAIGLTPVYVPGDAWQSFAASLGQGMNCRVGQVGLAGQGIYRTPGAGLAGNIPNLLGSYNLLWSGVSRVFSPAPKYIVIAEGTNDGGETSAHIQANLVSILTGVRAACPTSWIIVVPPFAAGIVDSNFNLLSADITTAMATYQGTPDAKAIVLQLPATMTYGMGPGTIDSAQQVDRTHPTAAAHALFGSALAQMIITATTPAGGQSKISYFILPGSLDEFRASEPYRWAP